jgi:hypothetical protein
MRMMSARSASGAEGERRPIRNASPVRGRQMLLRSFCRRSRSQESEANAGSWPAGGFHASSEVTGSTP